MSIVLKQMMKFVIILFSVSFCWASKIWFKCCSLPYENFNSVEHVCIEPELIGRKNCSLQFDRTKMSQCQCSKQENVIDRMFQFNDLKNFPNLIEIDISFLEVDVLNFGFCNNENCAQINVKVMNMSHNKLKKIPPKLFDIMPNIIDIDASFNFIETFENSTFFRVTNLERLNVSYFELVYTFNLNRFHHFLSLNFFP